MIPTYLPNRKQRQRQRAERLAAKKKPKSGGPPKTGTLLQVATHECGHAVVCLALGAGTVRSIRLVVGQAGSCADTSLLTTPINIMAIGLGGVLAEHLVYGATDVRLSKADEDGIRMAQSQIHEPGDHWGAATNIAKSIIAKRAGTIREMSLELVKSGRLDAAEILAFMEGGDNGD